MGVQITNQIPVLEPVVHHPNPFMNFIIHHYWGQDEEFVNWFYLEQLECWEHDTPDIETTEFIRHINYLQFLDGGEYNWETNPVPLGSTYQQVRQQGLIEIDGQEPPVTRPNRPIRSMSLTAESDDDE